jgi:hypothetical protein
MMAQSTCGWLRASFWHITQVMCVFLLFNFIGRIKMSDVTSIVGGGLGVASSGLNALKALIQGPATASSVTAGGGVEQAVSQTQMAFDQRMVQQIQMNEMFQEQSFKTTAEKNRHDTAMTVIRNMKVSG